MKILSKNKLCLLGAALFFLCVIALFNPTKKWSKADDIHEIPIAISLPPGGIKSTLIKFATDEERIYGINLAFFHDENKQGDRKRIRALIGDQPTEEQNPNGVSVLIRASLHRADKIQAPDFEKIVADSKEIKIRSWGSNVFNKEVAAFRLEKGVYELRIESISVDEGLRFEKIQLKIVKAYRGK